MLTSLWVDGTSTNKATEWRCLYSKFNNGNGQACPPEQLRCLKACTCVWGHPYPLPLSNFGVRVLVTTLVVERRPCPVTGIITCTGLETRPPAASGLFGAPRKRTLAPGRSEAPENNTNEYSKPHAEAGRCMVGKKSEGQRWQPITSRGRTCKGSNEPGKPYGEKRGTKANILNLF